MRAIVERDAGRASARRRFASRAPSGDVARLAPLDRQLRWLFAYALVTYPFACVPCLFLFFAQHGMDDASYGEILGAYYFAMFVAEVPTGVLADRIGARPMLVAGPALLASGFGMLLLAPGYAGFIVGEVLLGVGHAVLSGPPTVALYETLRAHGEQHRYLAEESRVHARRLFGTGAAFLLGGVLASVGNASGDAYGLAVVATCVLCLGAAAIGTRIAPPRTPPQRRPEFVAHARRELTAPGVRWLLAYWIVLFALLRFPFHDYQPYLRAAATLEPWFADPIAVGALFALLNLFAAPLSSRVPQLVARYGRRPLFWGMPMLLAGSLLVMAGERQLAATGAGSRALCWLGVAMFFAQQVPFGMHWPLVYEFVNHRIGSAARTTVLSVLSLGARLVYALLNVALFHVQDTAGIATALATAGIGGAVAAVLVMRLRPRGLLRGDGPIDTP